MDAGIIATLNTVAFAVGAIFVYLNTRAINKSALVAKQAKEMSAANNVLLQQTQQDVRTLEVHTNSLKDALVASTAKASYQEGHADALRKS